MDVKILNKFTNGRSGASVYLAEYQGTIGVYKTGIKNVPALLELRTKIPFRTPIIYEAIGNEVFMEYIDGISVFDYLNTSENVSEISKYICSYIKFSFDSAIGYKDFSKEIEEKILQVSDTISPSVYDGIPRVLPNTIVHGDFTFDNLIYSNGEFVMIDLSPTQFSSIYFDINKLRQDLNGLWFARNKEITDAIVNKCKLIYYDIATEYPNLFNDSIYRLMVSRIISYCEKNSFDLNYVMNLIVGYNAI